MANVALPHAVAATAAQPAGQATMTDRKTLDAIYAALNVDRVPADYVILIDTSSSMRSGGRYDAVKNSLRSFFAALAPEDQVTLIPFAGDAVPAWQGAAGRSPDALIDRLPPGADGANTDIGKALEVAVKTLGRQGAPTTANVVLLSDGEHDPARGSQYPFTSGYAWNELKANAAKLPQISIRGTAIPLAGATGATLLGQVFAQTETINPAAIGELAAALDKTKEAARAAKAKPILAEDLARTVEVNWAKGANASGMRLTFHSPMRHLPLQISRITVSTTAPGVQLSVSPSSVTLAPGQSSTVEVTADWDTGGRSFLPISTSFIRVPVTATAEVSSPWADALRNDLALAWSPGLPGNSHEAELSAQRGSWMWWLTAIALLAVLAMIFRSLRMRYMHPALHGVLSASRQGSDDVTQMPLRGRQSKLTAANIGLPGYGEVRLARTAVLSPSVDLVIRYSRDGSPGSLATARCAPNGSTELGDVTFAWRPARQSGG